MFEWKVEDMKLMNENRLTFIGKEKIFPCEYDVPREEKISFVDSLQRGKLSYLLGLIDKFAKDSKNMPKDQWGDVKTVSLKAWLKKNDERCIFNNTYYHGSYSILGTDRNIKVIGKGSYDTYEDLVDECFHRQLKECERMERKYFDEHDEYTIMRKSVEKNIEKYKTTFGVNIIISSFDGLLIGDIDNSRKLSFEELKELNSKYERLENYIEKLTEETHIVY